LADLPLEVLDNLLNVLPGDIVKVAGSQNLSFCIHGSGRCAQDTDTLVFLSSALFSSLQPTYLGAREVLLQIFGAPVHAHDYFQLSTPQHLLSPTQDSISERIKGSSLTALDPLPRCIPLPLVTVVVVLDPLGVFKELRVEHQGRHAVDDAHTGRQHKRTAAVSIRSRARGLFNRKDTVEWERGRHCLWHDREWSAECKTNWCEADERNN